LRKGAMSRTSLPPSDIKSIDEAMELGYKKFWGKPCKKCGTTLKRFSPRNKSEGKWSVHCWQCHAKGVQSARSRGRQGIKDLLANVEGVEGVDKSRISHRLLVLKRLVRLNETEPTPERWLWIHVLAQVEEDLRLTGSARQEAEEFMNSHDFPVVCELAGVHPREFKITLKEMHISWT